MITQLETDVAAPAADLTHYIAPDRTLWRARIDGTEEDVQRWHQRIQLTNLKAGRLPALQQGQRGIVLLGFRSDEGVARNKGRVGAVEGPVVIRKSLAGMPVHFGPETVLADGGCIACKNGNLEEAQAALGTLVAHALGSGYHPIVLGGGHEVAYANWLGLTAHRAEKSPVAVVNFDAHLDLRDIDAQGPTSGNSFSLMARDCQQAGQPFSYMCIGLQKLGNTRRLLETAQALGTEMVSAQGLSPIRLEKTLGRINGFVDRVEAIQLTVCLDVFSAGFAPGVSSPNPMGLFPDACFLECFHAVLASGKIITLDIAEMNPIYDSDNRTAKLAAALIFEAVSVLSEA